MAEHRPGSSRGGFSALGRIAPRHDEAFRAMTVQDTWLKDELAESLAAQRPTVEVAAPAVHLPGGHLRRLVDERGEHPHLVPVGRAQRRRERVVAAEPLRVPAQLTDGYAEGLVRRDRVACHSVAGALGALAREPGEDLGCRLPHDELGFRRARTRPHPIRSRHPRSRHPPPGSPTSRGRGCPLRPTADAGRRRANVARAHG